MALGKSDKDYQGLTSVQLVRQKKWEAAKALLNELGVDADAEWIEDPTEAKAKIPSGFRAKIVMKG